MSEVIIVNVDNGEIRLVDTSYSLSANFKVREFRSRESEVVLYSQRHVDYLQMTRDYYDMPMSLTNSHRTLTHNADVGGDDDSDHLYGKASDIYIPGINASDLKLVVSKLCGWNSIISTYKNTNHVHVATDCGYGRWYHNGDMFVRVGF